MAPRRLPLPWLIGATVVVVVAAIAVVVLGGGGDGDADSLPDRADVEGLALDPLTGGGQQQLGDLLGERPVVLNLFASWCQPCIEEMPTFERVQQDLGDEVAFAGLAIRNPPDKALELVEQTGVTYPTFADPADAAPELFDVVNMPTTIFFDADGNVVRRRAGRLTEDQLRTTIHDELGVAA